MKDKRFLAAVAIAAIFGMDRMGFRDYLKAAWSILLALTARKGKVAPEVFEARMKCCEECPIYARGTASCGSALSDNPELGCGCYLPLKNTLPESTCWADGLDTPYEFGWKQNGVK